MPSIELERHLRDAWQGVADALRPPRPGDGRGDGVLPALRVVVGFSGGLDSTVLVDLLGRLRDGLRIELVAAHVHHGLQPDADAWASACEAFCREGSVPFHLLKVRVERDFPAGLEAAARDARRRALASVGAQVVALAQHRDDQAETVLFRALRGAGPRGLAAMAPLAPFGERCVAWRPLLDVPRTALLEYARSRGLRWHEDPSNLDPRFTRNYLRHQAMPVLERRFPGAARALARSARLCSEASGLLDELAAEDAMRLRDGDGTFGRAAALELSSARLRNLWRHQLVRRGAKLPDEDRLLEIERQFRDVVDRPFRGELGAWSVCAHRDRMWLESAAGEALPESRPWLGETACAWGARSEIRFVRTRGDGLAAARLSGRACWLRPRAGGEALRLASGGPTRSLKKLLQQAAVPPWLRERVPCLWVDGELAWVGGIGVAAAFRCGPDEAGVLPEWERGQLEGG